MIYKMLTCKTQFREVLSVFSSKSILILLYRVFKLKTDTRALMIWKLILLKPIYWQVVFNKKRNVNDVVIDMI